MELTRPPFLSPPPPYPHLLARPPASPTLPARPRPPCPPFPPFPPASPFLPARPAPPRLALQLDAGSDEKVMLMSRDEQSCLVVSYREIKGCVEAAFK